MLSRLAEKHQALATYAIRALCDFLTEPSPLLYKLYRHTSQKLDGEEQNLYMNERMKGSKEYRAFQIFEKLRDAAIEGLCRLVLLIESCLFSAIDTVRYVFVWISIQNVLKLY